MGTSEHELDLDTWENPSTSPTTSSNKQTNQKDTQSGVPKGVRDHTTSVHIEVEQTTSDHQIKPPTNKEWGEFAAQLPSAANDTSKRLDLYLASINGTMKELGPCLTKVNRTLERLEKRLAPVVQPTPFVVDGLGTQPRDVSTPQGHGPERVDWGVACEADRSSTWPTVNEQLSGPSVTESTTSFPDIDRESRVQRTPLGETFGATGPDTQP